MKKKITTKATFNLFKMHYEDAEYFFSMAKKHKQQNNRKMEWRYSRNSILSYYLSIESLINFILYDQHNKKIFSTSTLENLEKMSISDKYLLVPLIYKKFSGETLDKDNIKHLNNLSKLRNDYVHGKHFKGKPITKMDVIARIFTTSEGLKEVLPEIPTEDKRDELTGLKENIFSLDQQDALKMKEITDRLFRKMNNLLNGLVLGKKNLSSASKNELFAESAGLINPLIESDFIVDLSEKEFKEFDDYNLKNIFTKIVEEKLSGKIEKKIDSFSARQKEELIAELVRQYKLRRK